MTGINLELTANESRETERQIEIYALCALVTTTTVAVATLVGSTFHTWYSGIAAAVFIVGRP